MKLYPPYKSWTTPVTDLGMFKQFLGQKIYQSETNLNKYWKGKIFQNSFQFQVAKFYWNTTRPIVHGKIIDDDSEHVCLKIHLECSKTIIIMTLVMSLLCIIASVVNSNPFVLIGIPVIVVWFYVVGYIFWAIELDEAKLAITELIKNACS
jgi:hypothetical protein